MKPKHTHAYAIYQGNDGIARFSVCLHNPGNAVCTHCAENTNITFKYRMEIEQRLIDRWGLYIHSTMLTSIYHELCPSCWSKMQRQVTHIAEKGAAQGKCAP